METLDGLFLQQLGNACGLVVGGLTNYGSMIDVIKSHEYVKPALRLFERIVADLDQATFRDQFGETFWFGELSTAFRDKCDRQQREWLERAAATLQKLATGAKLQDGELEELQELMDIFVCASAQSRQIERMRHR